MRDLNWRGFSRNLAFLILLLLSSFAATADPWLVFEGASGPGLYALKTQRLSLQ